MRKAISPRTHGTIDYLAVALFALAPAVLGLVGAAAALSYALAGVHLLMTLATAFPLGAVAVVPFRVHGRVEAAVGVALLAAALLLFRDVPFLFFAGMGALILAVWALTDYGPAADRT